MSRSAQDGLFQPVFIAITDRTIDLVLASVVGRRIGRPLQRKSENVRRDAGTVEGDARESKSRPRALG